MGLEISWYLRFSRGDSLEVLVKPEAEPQVRGALYMEPHWDLDVERQFDGTVRALFTRKASS